MADEIGTFTPAQSRALWQDLQTRQALKPSLQNNTRDRRTLPQVSVLITGQAIDAITAAIDALTGETTFTFSLLRNTAAGDLEDSGLVLTGTNRDTVFAADAGTVIVLGRVDGEWRPLGAGGAGAADCCCACTCIDNGDIEVDGLETSSRWAVQLNTVTEVQANGSLVLPAADHYLDWDSGAGYWIKTVTPEMTAAYTSGNDATGATTMTGTLILRKDDGGYTTLKLAFTGTVPAE